MNKALCFAIGAVMAVAAAPVMAPAFAQGTPQVVTAVDITAIAMGYRSSKILGSDVVNENGGKIGKLDDLIITRDHRALFAVVAVGGYLGVGDKLIAVRYDELRATTDDKGFVLAGATKESLKALPEFAYAH